MTQPGKSKVQQVPPEVVQEIIDLSLALDEEKAMAQVDNMARVAKFVANPTIVGAENIPQGPVLYISNHSTMAMDVTVALPALQQASGRFVRGMSDEIMYRTPTTRKLVTSFGAVMGHADIGDAMFDAGKDLLLFPGGAYEANKDLDQRYTLQWKKRTGFTRMAAKHGVPIVPVGIVGPDEWFGRYMDREEVTNSWVGQLLRWGGASEEFLASDQVPVIPRGIFGSLIPRPQRAYICIGKPISTARFKGKSISKASQEKLRDKTRDSLQECISRMLLLQSQDRDSLSPFRRFLSFY
jgi:1-acyl-sn-glycerol-3-phosphate acyltransferase